MLDVFGNNGIDSEVMCKYFGKKITDVVFSEHKLVLTFENDGRICIFDDAQSCCESRYMTCDDDYHDLIGGILSDIACVQMTYNETNEVHDDEKYDEVHESAFVKIQTHRNSITIVNHNEHNWYYSGFGLLIREI